MAQKGRWNVAREKMLEDRGALPKEDGYHKREYKAMHEESFLSRWLGEDVEGTEEGRKNMNKGSNEEESRSGKREVEREGENGVQQKVCESASSKYFRGIESLGGFRVC